MGVTASGSARVCQPSTLRMVIWPEASSAQNSIAAVSAEGSTVCVLIRRLNSSCNRSIAFVVRADFHVRVARALPEARQGLREPGRERARLPLPRHDPPHAAAARKSFSHLANLPDGL